MNGFRNIQTLIRKLKSGEKIGKAPYDFVEVMACPSGSNENNNCYFPFNSIISSRLFEWWWTIETRE